jgi:hypothetical protein
MPVQYDGERKSTPSRVGRHESVAGLDDVVVAGVTAEHVALA